MVVRAKVSLSIGFGEVIVGILVTPDLGIKQNLLVL
jgi:hypothetical protein